MSLEQWESYHRTGALATCPTAADGGYDLEMRSAWVEFFSTLGDGSRVLDIGTGNGVVALIASETATRLGRHWDIHASDLAAIDPVAHVRDGARRLADITFHPRVATERLPFEAESFDAVSGHYALEYSDTLAALAEVRRVLKPGGDAQFVMHHADSVLVHSARQSLREADLVFNETKIYRRLHRLVGMGQVTTAVAQAAANELRVAIRRLKQELQPARSAGGGRVLSVALDAVQKLLTARKGGKSELIGLEVDRVESDMRDSVRRLNDLIAHAQSVKDLQTLEIAADAMGFTMIEHIPVHHSGINLVGWQLMLHRP